MTDVDETLEDVFFCLPCLQVNRSREVCKRYRTLIEAKGELWMPSDVVVGMLQNFHDEIYFENFTRNVIGYPSPYASLDDVEVLNAKECVLEIEQSRETSARGFKQRLLLSFGLSVSSVYDNGAGTEVSPCDKYCSPQCPHKTDVGKSHIVAVNVDHIVALKDNVNVDEVMTLFAHVTADHYELYAESSAFTTELIGRMFQNEKMKAAKTLAIELVYHPVNELWGPGMPEGRLAECFCSPGNEERVVVLENFHRSWSVFEAIIQKFVAAVETKHFGRMLYVQIDEDMRMHCIVQLRALGHIPLVVDNLRTTDRTTIFVFENPVSCETLALRFGWQCVAKYYRSEDDLWACFKRLPDAHTASDIFL